MSMPTPSGDTFAAGLARELAEHCALELARQAISPVDVAPALSPDCLRLLALLRSDLLQVASVMSIAASVANRRAARSVERAMDEAVMPFEPQFSSIGIAAANRLAEAYAVFDVTQHWQNVCARLTFAINISKSFAPSEKHQISGGGSEIVADAWRRACGAMLGLHTCLASQMATAGLICEEKVEALTLDMLRAAARGEQPCIDLEGHLSVPGWAERRRKPRRNSNIPVKLQIGPRRSHATLVDVSAMGLGLQYPALVPERTTVTVWLSDGRGLKGIVSWSKAGRVGVRLDHPLLGDDPLLSGTIVPATPRGLRFKSGAAD